MTPYEEKELSIVQSLLSDVLVEMPTLCTCSIDYTSRKLVDHSCDACEYKHEVEYIRKAFCKVQKLLNTDSQQRRTD